MPLDLEAGKSKISMDAALKAQGGLQKVLSAVLVSSLVKVSSLPNQPAKCLVGTSDKDYTVTLPLNIKSVDYFPLAFKIILTR